MNVLTHWRALILTARTLVLVHVVLEQSARFETTDPYVLVLKVTLGTHYHPVKDALWLGPGSQHLDKNQETLLS